MKTAEQLFDLYVGSGATPSNWNNEKKKLRASDYEELIGFGEYCIGYAAQSPAISRERLVLFVESIKELVEQFPSGWDESPDMNDPSPPDAFFFLGGCIMMECNQLLSELGKPGQPLVLDQLHTYEWVVKCNGQIIYNSGAGDGAKEASLHYIYMNAICYKR